MGLSVKWDITYKCNLNCGHCINGKYLNNNQNEINIQDIKNIVNRLVDIDTEYIHLLGGEPTFRKDFIEICDYFKQNGIKFGFNTNGLNIMDENIRTILFNPLLKNIVFSLEGPTAEINDLIRGKNVFNVVVKNIKNIIKLKKEYELQNIRLSVNTVISNKNSDFIEDMIDFCVDLGIDEINLLQMIDEGNAKDKDLLLSDEQEIDLVNKVAIKYNQLKDKIIIQPKFVMPIVRDYCKKILKLDFPKYIHGCGAGTTFAFINNLGQLFPCDRYVDLAKQELNVNDLSLLTNNFHTIWGKSIFNQPFNLTEGIKYYKKYIPCNKCSHLKKDCFPCIVYGLNKNENIVKGCKKYFKILSENTEVI